MKVSKKIINLETESAFAILAKATKLMSQGKDIINLGIGQPDFPTPLNIQEAAALAGIGAFGRNSIISSYAQKRGIENQKINNAQEKMEIIDSSLQQKIDNIRSETYRQKPPIEAKNVEGASSKTPG